MRACARRIHMPNASMFSELTFEPIEVLNNELVKTKLAVAIVESVMILIGFRHNKGMKIHSMGSYSLKRRIDYFFVPMLVSCSDFGPFQGIARTCLRFNDYLSKLPGNDVLTQNAADHCVVVLCTTLITK